MTSICPFCKQPTGGSRYYLICSRCYLSPIHLIAKAEGLMQIAAGVPDVTGPRLVWSLSTKS